MGEKRLKDEPEDARAKGAAGNEDVMGKEPFGGEGGQRLYPSQAMSPSLTSSRRLNDDASAVIRNVQMKVKVSAMDSW
jgi:hypothetical protein